MWIINILETFYLGFFIKISILYPTSNKLFSVYYLHPVFSIYTLYHVLLIYTPVSSFPKAYSQGRLHK